MCRVSIIIPTYRRPETLINAIESVLNQTYNNIEVIVVDDNDPETEYRIKTETLMQKYRSDSRVRYICHDKNRNGAVARNTGIKASTGDFICFLDDDDMYYPDKVEEEFKFLLQHPDIDACYCWRKQSGRIIKNDIDEDLSKKMLLGIFYPTTNALMFRKNALLDLGGFDPSYRRYQDPELLLRFLQKYKISHIDKVLVEIVGCDGENQLHGKELEELNKKFLNDFKDQIDIIGSGNCKRRIHAHFHLKVSSDYIKHGSLSRGLFFLLKAFVVNPIYSLSRIISYLTKRIKGIVVTETSCRKQ